VPERNVQTEKETILPNNTTIGSRRLSNLDASFLFMESPVSPMHGGPIFFLKGELPFEKLLRHMEERLDIAPRFRQRLAFAPLDLAHATFEDDPNFKLENHVRRHRFKTGISEAEAIKEIVRLHFGRVMDRTRPLWDMTLFEGLPGRSFCVWATHHALVDGVSLFDLFNKTLDFTPDPPPVKHPAEPWTPAPPATSIESFFAAVRDLFVHQMDATTRPVQEWLRNPARAMEQLQTMARSAQLVNESTQAPIVATPWNAGVCADERSLAWLKLPFADFRAIRAVFGGTINDIVLTVLGEGAARYLKHHGWPTQGNLRIGCPVNVRRAEEQVVLENRVSIMTPMTPAEPMDVVERLKLIAAETKRIKESGLPFAVERLMSQNDSTLPPVMAAVSRMGTAAQEALAQLIKAVDWRPTPGGFALPPSGINFMASNVPGPQTAWYLAGYEVTDFVPMIMLAGQLGYGVAITSYNQNLFISMTAETRMMPDVERMKELVGDAFAELKRRVPVDVEQPQVMKRRSRAA
jgi:diacylglycerol O-acyltransferase / wax synthase